MTIAATKKHQFEMAPEGKFTNFYNLIFFSLVKNSFGHRQNLNYLCNRVYLGEKIEIYNSFLTSNVRL